jgi:hypothetical protein
MEMCKYKYLRFFNGVSRVGGIGLHLIHRNAMEEVHTCVFQIRASVLDVYNTI